MLQTRTAAQIAVRMSFISRQSYQEGTVRAVTHIMVRLASLPGAEDPG
jgi:hypothetical protein